MGDLTPFLLIRVFGMETLLLTQIILREISHRHRTFLQITKVPPTTRITKVTKIFLPLPTPLLLLPATL